MATFPREVGRFPPAPVVRGAGPGLPEAAGAGGPRIIPTSIASAAPGGDMTLDALMARQKELAGQRIPMTEMRSPMQGIAYALEKGLAGFQQGRTDRDISTGQQAVGDAFASMGPNGELTPEGKAAIARYDPDQFLKLWAIQQQKAKVEQWEPIPTPAGENGKWFRNQNGETKKVGGGSTTEGGIKRTDISTWRGQVLSDETYVNARKVVPTYQTMLAAANDTSGPGGKPGKISDLALVYGVATMLDPGSVVKEGEQIMVRDAQNLPDWLLGKINGINGGQEIGDDTRVQIMTLAHEKASSTLGAYENFAKGMRESAARNGFNPDDIVPNLGTVERWKGRQAEEDPNKPPAPDQPPIVPPKPPGPTAPDEPPAPAPAPDKPQIVKTEKRPDGSIVYTMADGTVVTQPPPKK